MTNVKDCHYPGETTEAKDFGWGGVGYHETLGTKCLSYPASYLGPGLWNYTSFCVPQRARDQLRGEVPKWY